jgi:glycosyl transferase family 25
MEFPPTMVINLDERRDRWSHALEEFAKIGIPSPQRVSGIRREKGTLGCTLSHIHCLEEAIRQNYESVFICEDDITFTNTIVLLESYREFMEKVNIKWDVLIVGGNPCPPYARLPQTDKCVRVVNCQTTTGYIVKKHYYNTLLQNFRETADKIQKGENAHIDIHWKHLQGKDRWFMLFPLTVVQYKSYSDIEKRVVDYGHLMLDFRKSWLFRA